MTCAHTCACVHTHTYNEVRTCLVMEAEPSLAGQSCILSTPVLSLCPCGGDTLSEHPDRALPELVSRVGGRNWKRGERDSWGVQLQCLGESFLESPLVTSDWLQAG